MNFFVLTAINQMQMYLQSWILVVIATSPNFFQKACSWGNGNADINLIDIYHKEEQRKGKYITNLKPWSR